MGNRKSTCVYLDSGIVGTAAVQVRYAWIDNRNKKRTEIRKSPFSYLYYAEKEKLIE